MKNKIENKKSIERAKKYRETYTKRLQEEMTNSLKKLGFPQIVQVAKKQNLNNYQSR